MPTKEICKVAALALLMAACGGQQEMPTPAPQVNLADQMLLATLWVQQSAEIRLIREQQYETAARKLKANMANYNGSKPAAVIVDIDETVLDNAPYSARLVQEGGTFDPSSWSEWVQEANAGLVQGAAKFLRYAESQGIEVFYISNRNEENLESTMENLRRHDLPFVDEFHVMLKSETSDKTERRTRVKEKYHVALLVGDQLTDFVEEIDWYAPDVPAEKALTDTLMNFFIALPNPLYGSFESRIYQNQGGLTDKQKDEYRRKALKTK